MMSVTLQQIRDYAYAYLELDEEDLPSALLDQWAEEGFVRVHRLVKRWPHYEATELASTAAGEPTVATSLVNVQSVYGPDGLLEWSEHTEAKRRFNEGGTPQAAGKPRAWSNWNGTVHLWPTPDAVHELTLEGHRDPTGFVEGGAGSTPDLPEDFHQLVRSWVMHRTYQHQDDFEGAQLEKSQFDELLAELVTHEVQAPTAAPLILGGARRRPSPAAVGARLLFPWE